MECCSGGLRCRECGYQRLAPDSKMKDVLNVAALVAGLISAFLWWKGSTITKRGMEPFQNDTHERTVYPFLERIGWWNKWAAIATAVAIGSSSIANFIG